jgi:hypothetical protein
VSVFSFDSEEPYEAGGQLVDGAASVPLPPASAGEYVRYAYYSGDASHEGSDQSHSSLPLVVSPAGADAHPHPDRDERPGLRRRARLGHPRGVGLRRG